MIAKKIIGSSTRKNVKKDWLSHVTEIYLRSQMKAITVTARFVAYHCH
jgi:hypothetical protein